MSKYYDIVVGVDLGLIYDHSSIAVLQRRETLSGEYDYQEQKYPVEVDYMVRQLIRPNLGTSYPEITEILRGLLDRSKERLQQQKPAGRLRVLVDATGCGATVAEDMLRAGLPIMPVVVHGGYRATKGKGYIAAPKSDLVGTLNILMGEGRIKVVPTLEHADTLQKEMAHFKMRSTKTNATSFESETAGDHDDLVFAVAVAAWFGEKMAVKTPQPMNKLLCPHRTATIVDRELHKLLRPKRGRKRI